MHAARWGAWWRFVAGGQWGCGGRPCCTCVCCNCDAGMAELLIWAEVRHQCGEGSSPAASGWECLSVLCRCAGALVCGRRHDATNETQNNVGVDKDGVSEVTGLGRIGGLPQIRIAGAYRHLVDLFYFQYAADTYWSHILRVFVSDTYLIQDTGVT